jgi:PLP dependent protein
MNNDNIAARYHLVSDQIQKTAQRSGRNIQSIQLVAVCKKQPVTAILEALKAGVTNFGENYPEEALEKINAIHDKTIHWHMIGHIQSRKAELVASCFDCVHSVDSLKIAQKLDNYLEKNQRKMSVLLEVNIGQEVTKSGFEIDTMQKKEQLIEDFGQIGKLKNLFLNGLMVMPPFATNPEDSRKYFQMARQLLVEFQGRFPTLEINELSMGTSVDYLVAIEEGATILRVGTAIFGKRG